MDETNKEVAWDLEFHKTMTDKIRGYYLDELEVDRYSAKSFKTNSIVTTFKVKKFTDYMEEKLEEINRIVEDERSRLNVDQESEGEENAADEEKKRAGSGVRTRDRRVLNKAHFLDNLKNELKEEQNRESEGKSEKFSREKMKREQEKRKKLRQELKAKEPKKEDIKNNAEIKRAQENIGDYKLKSSPDYEVPDKERMNMSKQKKHILLLEKFVYSVKMDFNKNLEKLRERKHTIIEKIKSTNIRIQKINEQLGVDEKLFEPSLDEELECPEKVFEVTDSEIVERRKEKDEEKRRLKGGMYGGGGDKEDGILPDTTHDKGAAKKKENVDLAYKARKAKTEHSSSLADEAKRCQELRLMTEKNILLTDIESDITSFDKEIEELKNDKIKLEYEMKMANMKLITYYQELVILEGMEDRDNQYLEKLEEQKDSINGLNLKKAEISSKIADKMAQEKKLEMELREKESLFFERIYPGERDKATIVYDIYKKGYKKRAEVERDDDDEYDEEEYMNEEDDIDDEFDADKKQIALAVQQNEDQFEIVKARHKLDEELNTVREDKKALLVENTKLDKKINELQKDLDITKKALKELQKQKLDKVSELYVSIFLRLDQIKNLIPSDLKDCEADSWMLPMALENSILFTEKSLRQLYQNISNLKKEQLEIEKRKQELNREREDLNQELQMLKDALKDATEE